MKSKGGLLLKKCRHFENILFEVGAVILGHQQVSNERAT
jgi:hypothetical protein